MTNLRSSISADEGDRISPSGSNRSFYWAALICLSVLTLTGLYLYYKNVYFDTASNESDGPVATEEIMPNSLDASTPDIPYTPSSFSQEQTIASSGLLSDTLDSNNFLLNEEEVAIKMQGELSILSNSSLLLDSSYRSNPPQQIAAIIDSLSKGLVIPRLLSLEPLKGKFPIIKSGSKFVMDPSGYVRFNPYVEVLLALNLVTLRDLFHEYRTYLERAYAALGYRQERFDNAVINSLDKIISAPKIETLIAIEQHEAVYRFLNKDLEALPEIHKQLLRMGPKNTEKIQSIAKELKTLLIEDPKQP